MTKENKLSPHSQLLNQDPLWRLSNEKLHQACRHRPVNPTIREAEAGGSQVQG